MNPIFLCVERASDSECQIFNVASVYTLRELIVNPIFLCVERTSDSIVRYWMVPLSIHCEN